MGTVGQPAHAPPGGCLESRAIRPVGRCLLVEPHTSYNPPPVGTRCRQAPAPIARARHLPLTAALYVPPPDVTPRPLTTRRSARTTPAERLAGPLGGHPRVPEGWSSPRRSKLSPAQLLLPGSPVLAMGPDPPGPCGGCGASRRRELRHCPPLLVTWQVSGGVSKAGV